MRNKKSISVIVPVAHPNESYQQLLETVQDFDEVHEILCVSPSAESLEIPNNEKIQTVQSEEGRGRAMNKGAEKATGQYLWFLHADSSLSKEAFSYLHNSLQEDENRLYYFNLRFTKGASSLMCLNAIGANIRSVLFGSPFGDQGFCLKRVLFFQLGGYQEDALYGEDHLFVWQCHHHGIKVQSCGGVIETSPRKYSKNGWLSTTLQHNFLWFVQVVPQFLKYLQHKAL